MKPLGTLLLLFMLCGNISAQLEKTIHQTFEVTNQESISLDIKGEVTVVAWPGNTILTETKVELYDAKPSIFNHFLEVERRYEIEIDTSGAALKLISYDQERKEIRTKNGVCPEIVQVKVFVPEEFQKQDEMTLVKGK